jgi:Hypothetical glycosyl hydrolase family 15
MQQTRMLVISIAFLFSGMATAFTEPPFPRLATVNFSSPQNYDNATFEAQLARYNIALLSIYPGWVGAGGKTMNQSVQGIKAINPQELVFLYINNNEIPNNDASMAALTNKVNAMHWWLYPSGTSGTPVPSSFSGATEVNNTLFTQRDSNGDDWVSWYAKWVVQNYYVPSPLIDGFFTDNVFYQPRVNGDWNLDGVTDSNTNATVGQWYRQGYNQHFALLNQQMPGKYQIGNVTDWGTSGANLSSLTGILNGGMIESMLGYSYSPETWGSWSEMMREYRVIMASVVQPQLVIFGQVGVANDYQGFRYGYTSCLMDNGYYEFSLAANPYSGTFWFDEFNATLGAATTNPATTAWQKGVYRRDFANGIALVNPRGNGAQTVQLETTYRKISGTQDPAINSGQTVQSVTLQDRDGIILLRTTAAAAPTTQPAPPASVTVH